MYNYQVFVDKAAIVLRRARMASTGVMVFRRLLEPALSLLRDSGGMVTVIRVVRAGHGQHHTVSVPASRRAPEGQLITQSSHFNAASPSLCQIYSQSSLISPLVRGPPLGEGDTLLTSERVTWSERGGRL